MLFADFAGGTRGARRARGEHRQVPVPAQGACAQHYDGQGAQQLAHGA